MGELLPALRHDVRVAIRSAGSPRVRLSACTDSVVRHLDAAFARIWTLEPGEDTLHLEASSGLYTHLDGPHSRVPVGKLKIGRIASTRQPHLTNDVVNDPHVGDHDWARREGMVAFAGYPLIAGTDLVGVLALFARRPLADSALDALAAVADVIALGIDRWRVEEALQQNRALLAEAEALTRCGSWDWALASGRVAWSDQLCRLVGASPGEVEPTFEGVLRWVHADDRDAVRAAFEDAVRDGKPARLAYRIVRRDGRVRQVQGRAEVLVSPDDGRAVRLVATAQDVTGMRDEESARVEQELRAEVAARRRAEDSLKFLAEASQRLASSLELPVTLAAVAQLAVPYLADWCTIDVLDEQGQPQQVAVEHVNPEKARLAQEMRRRYPVAADDAHGVMRVIRSGLSELHARIPDPLPREAARSEEHLRFLRELGLRSAILVPLRGRETVLGALMLVSAESGRVFSEADRALAEDLARRAASAIENARLYQSAQRALADRLALEAELSAREEQLRTSQKMEAIGTLAGGAAHFFNNLMLVVTGYSQQMLERLVPGDPLREDIAAVLEAGQRATEITQRLLAFARRQLATPGPVELNALVGGALPELRGRLGPRIQLAVQLAPEAITARADRIQLQQVLHALVDNARDAMPDGGTLTVATGRVEIDPDRARALGDARPGTYVTLAIADTGTGMAPEVRTRLFEPFFTTKGLAHRTGLGLASVYGIVKQSGGAISVETAPGQGTRFTLLLPPDLTSPAGRPAGT